MISVLIKSILARKSMKQTFALIIAASFFFSVMGSIPRSQAPKPDLNREIVASIIQDKDLSEELESEFKYEDPELIALIKILELYIEEKRDFDSAQTFLDQVPINNINQKILELYQFKISSRSLDFAKAEELLNLVDDDSVLLLKAAVLIASGQHNEASAYFHNLVDNHPSAKVKSTALALLSVYSDYNNHKDTDESYLWTLFAQKIGEWQEYEISLFLATKASEEKPNYRDAWIIRAYNELNLKQNLEAETSLLKAYELDPGNAQIQYLLGLTYFELEKTDLSNQYLLYSMQNETPYTAIILEKLAENAVKSEDYALAIHYFESLLEARPGHKQALSRLIWVYTEQENNLEKAEEKARELIQYHSTDPNSYHLLSWVLSQRGDLEESLKSLEKAKELEE